MKMKYFVLVVSLFCSLILPLSVSAQAISTNLTLDQLSTQNLGVTHDTTTFYLYGGNDYSQARTNTSTYGFNITNKGNFYTTGLSADLSNSTDLSTLIDQKPNGKHYIFVRFFNQVQFSGVTSYQQPIYGNFSTANNDLWYTKGFGSDIELTQVAQDVNTLSYSTEQDDNTTHTTYYDIVTLVFQVNRCTRYCGTTNRLNFGSLQQFPNVASYNNTTGVTIRYNMLTLNYFDAESNSSIDLSNIETSLAQIVQNTSNSTDLSTVESYLQSIDGKISNLNFPTPIPSTDYTYDLQQIEQNQGTTNTSLAGIGSDVASILNAIQGSSSGQDYTQDLSTIVQNTSQTNQTVTNMYDFFTDSSPIPSSVASDFGSSNTIDKQSLSDIDPTSNIYFATQELTSGGFDFSQTQAPCEYTGNYLYLPVPKSDPFDGSTTYITFPISSICARGVLKNLTSNLGSYPGGELSFMTIFDIVSGGSICLMILLDMYRTFMKVVAPEGDIDPHALEL